jgi:predicted PurR-regulated permease PerM
MLPEAANRGTRVVHFATAARAATADPRRRTIIAALLVLLFGAVITMWPFVAPLVLAAWAAHLSRPLYVRTHGVLGGRGSAAGLLTALLVVVALLPLVLAIVALVPAAESLLEQLRGASGGKGVLAALVSNGGAAQPLGGKGVISLVREYGASVSKAFAVVAGTSLRVLVGAFVFFVVFFSLLVEGAKWWAWAHENSPEPTVLERLRGAFYEAGRGLVVGAGLTALLQGALAGIFFAAFGVPRALLLGVLSTVAALVPMVGTMIVWIPVCAGLALTGHPGKALALAALCAGVVGSIDNIVRPWLSRRFHVGMPATVVLVSMLGGVIVFGGWGLFLGPLILRLAGEMISVCHERRLFGRAPAT